MACPGVEQRSWRFYQNGDYRYTWMGQVVSEIGDHFNNIAVFVLAMELTRSG